MARSVLPLIILLFVACRLPPILHQAGAMDEEWFAVPGLTVAREGIPRVPYARATAPSSMFLGAEQILFAMPPLTFYAQAPFFLILPPTHATARIPSLLAGCLAIWLVSAITRLLWEDRAAGLWAAGIYSLCRLVYFPAGIARPDMICGAFGLAAVWAWLHWRRGRQARWLIAAGGLIGLGGLTHPFALVFALQLGVGTILAAGSWRVRLARGLILTTSAVAVFAAWLILILQGPELFWPQFSNNILRPSGPGLATRLVFSSRNLVAHLPLVIERAGGLQAAFLGASLLIVTGVALRARERSAALVVAALGWSGVYLLIALQGNHPLQGYWCYPVGFFAIAAGWCLARGCAATQRQAGTGLAWGVSVLLVAVVFLPGSGLRASWAYVRHGGALNYNPPRFTRAIVADLPRAARLTVGAAFALDAYATGRTVVLGIRHPDYYDATQIPFDYAILGRTELEQGVDKLLWGQRIATFGDEADPFSCYAVLIQAQPGKPGL